MLGLLFYLMGIEQEEALLAVLEADIPLEEKAAFLEELGFINQN